MTRFAKIISLILHPLWMPLVIYLLVRWLNPYFIAPSEADKFVFLLLTINIVAPALSMLIMIRYGILSNIELSDRKERLGPYLLVIFYYVISYSLLRWKDPGLPHQVFSFFLAVIISLITSLTVNLFWKISVHMLAQGGVFGTIMGVNAVHRSDVMVLVIASILMAAITGFSRIHINAHTPGQVYAGFALGVAVNWMVISFSLVI